MGRLRFLGQVFAATWLIAATAWAQSAQIQGRLVDEQGGAIPGAQVTAVDEEKGVIARQTTSGTRVGGVIPVAAHSRTGSPEPTTWSLARSRTLNLN